MAMFSSLSEKLENAFKKFRSRGKLTEADVKAGMREIKLALLEADVNFKVVKDFVRIVSERAVGTEVMESLMPGQQIVKIVDEELTRLMGGSQSKLEIAPKPPTIVMMVGLQGAGKTTHAGKLAGMYKKQGKRPLLVACDVYRPAAIRQLEVLGEKLDIPVFQMGDREDPVRIAAEGVKLAEQKGYDMVFIDTAGRLQIDEALMNELIRIKQTVKPTEILLTVDSMIGQESVNVAETFNNLLDITGVILTKLDGDTRGGAALSIKAVTGKPILYVGMGEKLSDLEQFYPDRMASRILGMGDVLSIIDKASAVIDEEKAKELGRKIKKAEFDYNDFLDQMNQIKKMGGMASIMSMMPGMGQLKGLDLDENEKTMGRVEAIILSMTAEERRNPDLMNPSRKKRIAQGAGVDIAEVNRLVKQFGDMKKLMKQLPGMAGGGKRKGLGGLGGMLGKMKLPF